jgi:hypothetical protein
MGLTLKNRASLAAPEGGESVVICGARFPKLDRFLAGEYVELIEMNLVGKEALGPDDLLRIFSVFTRYRLPEGEGMTFEELMATPVDAEELKEISDRTQELVAAIVDARPAEGNEGKVAVRRRKSS